MRIVFLDYLRVAAIFMVLLVHACELYYFGGDGGFYIATRGDAIWVTAIDSACRAAVPLFVMASAYLLFPVTRPAGEFLRRRVLRVGVPFLLWAVVYTLRFRGNLAALCFNFPNEGGHLWFVPMILGVYLVMPMLSPWVERMDERELGRWILAWLVTTLFPYVRHLEGALVGAPSFGAVPYLYGECPWNGFGTFHYVSGFVGYVLLGHWFRKYCPALSWRRTLAVALPLGIAGWLIVAGFFFFRIPDAAGYPVSRPYAFAVDIEMSWEYCSLGVAMMVVAWFLVLRKHVGEGWTYRRVIRPLAEASFGVYLVHMLILTELAQLLKPRLATPLAIAAVAAGTFLSSALVSLALRRIPVLGKWSGFAV